MMICGVTSALCSLSTVMHQGVTSEDLSHGKSVFLYVKNAAGLSDRAVSEAVCPLSVPSFVRGIEPQVDFILPKTLFYKRN